MGRTGQSGTAAPVGGAALGRGNFCSGRERRASKQRFDRLDANHDGTITRAQFQQQLEKMERGRHAGGEH